MARWIGTNFPGVRYREHPTRKHGIKKDRYFTVRYKLEGKDKEEGLGWSSQGWTAQRAVERLAELKQNQRIGQGPQTLKEKRIIAQQTREQAERDTLMFSQAWEQYIIIAMENKTKSAWQSEVGLYNHWIKPVIGGKSLRDVSPLHLERIKKNMADTGKAARSIHYALAVIRQLFNYTRNIGLFAGDNPVSKVKKPTADNRRLRFLSHEDAARLLEALALRSTEVHDMVLISLHAGLRFGEIAGLTWGDLDIDKGLMTLRDTKAGRNRMAYMTAEIKKILKARSKGGNDDLVFPGRNGKRKSSISNVFERTVQVLGLNNEVTDPRQKVVFHTARHTYASWLVQAGVDLYQVKALMGHSTLSQTERYSHLGNNALQNATKTFESAIQAAKKPALVVELKGA